VNGLLAIYSVPVTDFGDAPDYIEISKTLLGEGNGVNFAHRSPLYSIIMAGFMTIFDEPAIFKIMVIFQFILVAVSCCLIYVMFLRLFTNKMIPAIIAVASNFLLSTIYYATIILTEILGLFLLISALHFLFRFFDKSQWKDILILGTMIGLLSLAKFNAIPLILTFAALSMYTLYLKKASLTKWAYTLSVLFVPYLIIINAWSFYNYQHNGFYGLFPGSYRGVSRNIIIASIHPENRVSETHQPVLDIFLKAREEYLVADAPTGKGSLSQLDKFGILSELYGGFRIYLLAVPKLNAYYKLPAQAGEYKLAQKLSGFYREIAKQNTRFIWKYRLFSLVNSFRASTSASLPLEYGAINLNILPSAVFWVYKLGFFGMSVFVFLAFFVFWVKVLTNKSKPNFTLLTMFFIVFSFWGINFVFVAEANSNRYKFPADPLIIGLFLYYGREAFQWAKSRNFFLRLV